ncbi:MAG TPA: FtsX-like permease family protein, partial [Gemmatimonadaceae bacterium]|nr:FtsX-like permease family protein [Gemmatimonadaceae bacterium]
RSRLIEGRAPDSTTRAALAGVGGVASATPIEVVVNESLVRQLFPNGNALGARLHDAATPRGPGQTSVVVGVVEDVNMPGALRTGGPTMFRLPLSIPETPFVVRTSGSTQTLAAALRRAVKDANPGNIAYTVMTGDAYLRDAMAPTTFAMALLAAFSAVALLLSAVGLYGVIAYTVTQRTREIGIRVALGAEPGRVAALVVGGGVKLAAAGAVLGTVAAAASTRVLGGLLFGVSPGDPATFGAIVLLIVTMSVVACYVPARRAIRVDPIDALRAE